MNKLKLEIGLKEAFLIGVGFAVAQLTTNVLFQIMFRLSLKVLE